MELQPLISSRPDLLPAIPSLGRKVLHVPQRCRLDPTAPISRHHHPIIHIEYFSHIGTPRLRLRHRLHRIRGNNLATRVRRLILEWVRRKREIRGERIRLPRLIGRGGGYVQREARHAHSALIRHDLERGNLDSSIPLRLHGIT